MTYQAQTQAGAAAGTAQGVGIDPQMGNPYVQPGTVPGVQTSPAAAFWLGLIPGVGAIYNGQYAKGIIHGLIFGLLIAMANAAGDTAGVPLLAMVMVVFYFYMPFEAYHTARKRQLGIPVDEWSSLVVQRPGSSRLPLGPIVLIALGVLFLLDTLHLIEFRDIDRFWPVILILVGAFMLYNRIGGRDRRSSGISASGRSTAESSIGDQR